MSLVASLEGPDLVNDRSGTATFSSKAPSCTKRFARVENLGVMRGDAERVAQALTGLTEQFTGQKLLLRPGEIQHETITARGIEVTRKVVSPLPGSAMFVKVYGACFDGSDAVAGRLKSSLVIAHIADWLIDVPSPYFAMSTSSSSFLTLPPLPSGKA